MPHYNTNTCSLWPDLFGSEELVTAPIGGDGALVHKLVSSYSSTVPTSVELVPNAPDRHPDRLNRLIEIGLGAYRFAHPATILSAALSPWAAGNAGQPAVPRNRGAGSEEFGRSTICDRWVVLSAGIAIFCR